MPRLRENFLFFIAQQLTKKKLFWIYVRIDQKIISMDFHQPAIQRKCSVKVFICDINIGTKLLEQIIRVVFCLFHLYEGKEDSDWKNLHDIFV